MSKEREFDVVVWGSSGFTGSLVSEYLFKNYSNSNNLKWAIAGRNLDKLKKIRAKIADDSISIIIADSNDESSIVSMVKRTKVICTTVGPYAKYGSNLVKACVENYTHYCDLAGEVQWIRKMIDKYHVIAKSNNVKIVNCCGFDSIPSDMGVYFMHKESAKVNKTIKKIEMRVAGAKGGISGGTYESLSNVNKEALKDKNIFKTVIDPYGLNPVGEQEGPDRYDLRKVIYDKTSQNWIGPFIMAAINTKIVRRSNALSGYSYGKEFEYDEATLGGKGFKGRLKSILMSIPIAIVMLAKPESFVKKIVDKILPKAGEGPSKLDRENGYYNLRFYVTYNDGSKAIGKVTGDMDPGYGSTSKMLSESAICLAKDNLDTISGVITPSTAMGDFLLERLIKKSGLTFNIKYL
jgi:short subunit dehydrogenase-like uncharacterized protein